MLHLPDHGIQQVVASLDLDRCVASVDGPAAGEGCYLFVPLRSRCRKDLSLLLPLLVELVPGFVDVAQPFQRIY